MTAGTSAPDGTIPIDLPGSLSVLTVPFIFTQDELLDTGTFIETVKARGFELSLADLQELHALGLLLPLFRVDDDPELALKMD